MKKNFSFLIFNFSFIIVSLFLTGCVNKEGISLNYYPECKENYDLYGVYYKKCDNNIYNFKKKKRKICLDCN
jgi:hypothetical protein